jgi:hypothetical protein
VNNDNVGTIKNMAIKNIFGTGFDIKPEYLQGKLEIITLKILDFSQILVRPITRDIRKKPKTDWIQLTFHLMVTSGGCPIKIGPA